MATFTIELGKLVEDGFDIGLNKYPIFNEEYRIELNDNIIRHFYFHEIGFETAEMFAQQMDSRMRLIMPRLNKVYETTLIAVDPLASMVIKSSSQMTQESDSESNRTQTGTQENQGTANSSSDTESKSKSVNSVFPQNMITDNGEYATNAAENSGATNVSTNAADSASSKSVGSANDKSTGKGKSVADTLTSGYTGSPGDLLLRYRAAIVNVDEMVIDELSDMFMSIVQIPDSFTERPWHFRGPGPLAGFNVFGNMF